MAEAALDQKLGTLLSMHEEAFRQQLSLARMALEIRRVVRLTDSSRDSESF